MVALDQAFKERAVKLQEQMSLMLGPRREKLAQMASLVRTRAEEIQSERVKVERETTQDYEAIMDRLRNADATKQVLYCKTFTVLYCAVL